MKNFTAIGKSFLTLALASLFVAVVPASSDIVTDRIRATPGAPVFADAERHAELGRRRAAVLSQMKDDSVMVMWSSQPRIYSNDVDFMYRQENNLFYLTGLRQQDATLILFKKGAASGEILLIPKRNPQYETWNGRMYAVEDARKISGMGTIGFSDSTGKVLDALKKNETVTIVDHGGAEIRIPGPFGTLYALLPRSQRDENGQREYAREVEYTKSLGQIEVVNSQPIFAKLRLVKSPYEIKVLRHAIDISIEAHMRAMATVQDSRWEYETQAEIEYIFRRRGADYWGYNSIVGCGPNATTLHYVESQGRVNAGQLFLIDVGAEYQQYTADITRTFPVNGKFTQPQKEIYQIVYDAQEASAAKIRPGALIGEAVAASDKVIEEGLFKLGLITGIGAMVPGTEREIPDGKGGTRKVGTPQYKVWFMHGWGHWLGMNVHDPGDRMTRLEPGMVTTNEPGIYIREDALDYFDRNVPGMSEFIAKIKPAFERYRNIGVRIEDDILVTATGAEWMSGPLPRSIADIEKFMAKVRLKPNVAGIRAGMLLDTVAVHRGGHGH